MNKLKPILLTGLILFVMIGCDSSKEKVSTLEQELSEKDNTIHELKSSFDSLATALFEMEGKVEKYESDIESAKEVPQEELPIRTLVSNVHRGWEKMVTDKDKDALLQYFLTKYTTNGINVDLTNKPSVKRYSDKTFDERLDEILLVDNARLSFGDSQFLYTEVKGEIFATCYRTLLKVYIDEELQYTASVVSLMAGQKNDDWKVGNYSWVIFEY